MGFFEILLIAVITLLVVGPERMPEAVRNVALTVGRVKRSFNKARDEIEKQVGADDIRRQLHNEEVMENLDTIKSGLSDIHQQTDLGDIDRAPMENSHNQPDEKPEGLESKKADNSTASTTNS